MAGTNYTSRRRYLSQTELAEYADITITDTTEADDQISQAEELIDSYVGYQKKAVCNDVIGRVASATSTTITLESSRHQNVFQGDYFLYCEVEITGGTGIGQRRLISSSTYAGVVTVATAWSTSPDSTSYYRIYQLGKFPRYKDEYFDGDATPQKYTRFIPEEVKRATAAQVAYFIEMGEEFFNNDGAIPQSERIGDYSYSKGDSSNSSINDNLIAPRASRFLKGFVNRKGVMLV